jgi:DNA-binding NarL/FixJ family response regulator
MKSRIFVVEDHKEMRQAYALLINREPDLEIYEMAVTGEEALEKIESDPPDLVVIDLSLPGGMSGLKLIKQLHTDRPDLPLLVVSGHDDVYYAEGVLQAGAHGFVDKKEAPYVMVDAIRRVLQGEQYLSERMRQKLENRKTRPLN